MASLESFASSVHSQFGEDGIVGEILDRLERSIELSHWCVEFGAGDGVSLSNTCDLIRSRGYRAVMIEADDERVRLLATNHPGPEVIRVHARVGVSGADSLDSILAGTPIPLDFDVLSIDIDGHDFWVLDAIRAHSPKILLVEFNPTIPNSVCYVQPTDVDVSHGSSARSMLALAESKGYELVATTMTNLILLRSEFHDVVLGASTPRGTLEALRDDSHAITLVFVGFDGSLLFTRDELSLPWHGVTVATDRVQIVPRPWRSFPGSWPRNGWRDRSWRVVRRLHPSIARLRSPDR